MSTTREFFDVLARVVWFRIAFDLDGANRIRRRNALSHAWRLVQADDARVECHHVLLARLVQTLGSDLVLLSLAGDSHDAAESVVSGEQIARQGHHPWSGKGRL